MQKWIKVYETDNNKVSIISTSTVKEFVFNSNIEDDFFDAILIDATIKLVEKSDYIFNDNDNYFDKFLEFLNS